MAQITNHIENFEMNINEDFVRKAQCSFSRKTQKLFA